MGIEREDHEAEPRRKEAPSGRLRALRRAQGPRPGQGCGKPDGPADEGQLAVQAPRRVREAFRPHPRGVRRGDGEPRQAGLPPREPRRGAASAHVANQLARQPAVGRRRIAPRVRRVVRARRARPFGGDGHAARVRRVRQDVHAAAERDAVRAPAEHEDVPGVPRGGEEEPRRIEAGRAPDLRGVRRAVHGASEVAAPLPEVHRGAPGMHRRVPQEMARAAWDVSGWKE